MELSLPSIPSLQFSADLVVHTDLVGRPIRCHGECPIGLAGESVDHDLGRKEFNKVDEQRDIVLFAEKFKVSLEVYLFQGGILDDVQVVEFYTVNPHSVQEPGSLENLLAAFRGKSEDQVDAELQIPCLGPFHRVDEFPHSMSTVDQLKGLVIHGLQSELQPEVSVLR